MTTTKTLDLTRNAFGHLVLSTKECIYEGVIPVRAFPLEVPQEFIALIDQTGHEVAWITALDELTETVRHLIEEELAGREFIPEIRAILDVSSFATPCTWIVTTNRGETHFVLRLEEDIRRVGESLLITDSHGIAFLIKHPMQLDKLSRKLLDRFL